jgi:hypothetical protein
VDDAANSNGVQVDRRRIHRPVKQHALPPQAAYVGRRYPGRSGPAVRACCRVPEQRPVACRAGGARALTRRGRCSSAAGCGREPDSADQHRASRQLRWHHGLRHAPEPEGALPACVFDAKRRVQIPAIVASKRCRPSQGLGQLASTGQADELSDQHEPNDDRHMFCRHRGQPQSEAPGSRTLDLPASP